jgi:hypothetical protein
MATQRYNYFGRSEVPSATEILKPVGRSRTTFEARSLSLTPLIVLVEEESREIGGQATAVRAGTGSSNPPCSSAESAANLTLKRLADAGISWPLPGLPEIAALRAELVPEFPVYGWFYGFDRTSARRTQCREPRLGGPGKYLFLDRSRQGRAGVILMQLLPFADPKALALLDQFEKAVYASLPQ